ncbi:putative pre-rRNA processing protein Mrd1 [Xylona heveae TC161]|uniref:Multiple RNA-binding domain-containing protein 1 n=1 Tax=Xylona heveae (strain CBS 132557 / TC161) TaxID=1328760 RepID=A0A165GFF2_XYLHT|nr:putative pre-rRNA processing protein Mrd1 [Xylona heveae TC161]KZF22119.1 putative pre-rRNA processing protein Mrd1 [Xylona heveae TC161]
MASSRIFIRGLPPKLTENDFKQHFSSQQQITDAKLIPHRRIGYIGYKTPEDAQKAVKYFNKSFIRMSRIAVEIARPFNDDNLPLSRQQRKQDKATDGRNNVTAEAPGQESSQDNPLKRKREGRDDKEDLEKDPKLQEFLEVMQPTSKSHTWANEGAVNPTADTQTPGDEVKPHVPEAESDDEYEVVPKRSKTTSETHIPSTNTTVAGPDLQSNGPDAEPNGEHDGTQPTVPSEGEQGPSGPVSDADWLRSRTSRLLGLEDEDDEESNLFQRSQGAASLAPSAQPVEETEKQGVPNDISEAQEDVEMADPHEQDEKDSKDADLETISSTRRLFLRNLPFSTSEDDLRQLLGQVGAIEEVHLPLNPSSGHSKGFAYALFADGSAAQEAYQKFDGQIFQGRLLHILPAAAKRSNTLDEFAISKLPLKKQQQIKKKSSAASSTFSWNSLYMNADAVMSSVSERLGVSKSDLLDPTSSDAAVKQAHAETHVIQETKAYFKTHGVDLDAFKKRERGDTAILVKNFSYGTTSQELKKLFEEFGQVVRLLMPPTGTIAIVEYAQAPQARAAFSSLAYRKIKDSILFLEKAPKDLFVSGPIPDQVPVAGGTVQTPQATEAPQARSAELLKMDNPDAGISTNTLFVRNLNFATTTARLQEVFQPLDGFLSARVKTKSDPKRPGQTLSMGFGFLEFRTKAQAEAALASMNGYNLDGHQLLLRMSHKGMDAAEEQRNEANAKKLAGKRTKIIIKNLPFEATRKDIRALFGPYGKLRSVRLPKKFDSSTRGFAFADFVTPREAESAMDALKDTHLLGRRLVLDFAAAEAEDAEAEIEKMQNKVGRQVNKVALQRLTGGGRKKFNVQRDEDDEN